MSDQNSFDPTVVARIRADLNESARLLREGEHLDPKAQNALASLLDDLASELEKAAMPSQQTIHLAELTSNLARSLHQQQSAASPSSARETLAEAARWAETHAPVATGIVGRFIDVLSSIGI